MIFKIKYNFDPKKLGQMPNMGIFCKKTTCYHKWLVYSLGYTLIWGHLVLRDNLWKLPFCVMFYKRQINKIWYSLPFRYGVYGGYIIFRINYKCHTKNYTKCQIWVFLKTRNLSIWTKQKSDCKPMLIMSYLKMTCTLQPIKSSEQMLSDN